MKISPCLAAFALISSVPGVSLPVEMRGQALPATAGGSTVAAVERARSPDFMMTNGRISLPRPAKPLRLGEDNALVLTLKGPPPLKVFTAQRAIPASGASSPWIEAGDALATVKRNQNGQTYVNLVPLALGKLETRVNVFFSDGGFDQAGTAVDVVAGTPPAALVSSSEVDGVSSLRLDLSERGRRAVLWLSATYPQLKNPLPIDVEKAQFKITMSKEHPPIEFDPKTLTVNALRIGRALIQTHYDGASLATCVQVQESPGSYGPLDCRDLFAGDQAPRNDSGRSNESTLPYGPMDNRTGRFLADDRVDILTPDRALHIARNNAVTLRVTGPAIARIDCHPSRGDIPCEAWKGQWSRQGTPWTQNADGTVSVNLFPMNFGKQEFTFFIRFEDGGVALRKISAEVDAGDARPTSIDQGCDRESPEKDLPLRLVPPKNGTVDFRGKAQLVPDVCYDGVRTAVPVPAAAVKYQLRSDGNDLPIELEASTGKVKAVHPGQVLVQQSFAGLTGNTCVVVAPLDEPDASNCRQMRAKYGAPLPPLKVRVRAPTTTDEPERPEPGRAGLAGKPPEVPVVDAIEGARLSPDVRDRFNADQRLKIMTAGLVAELGQPTKLPVHLTGPEVLSLTIEQELLRYSPTLGAVAYSEPAYLEERNADRIGRNADGSSYLHVVPLSPETSEFRIAVLFADGGVATRTVRLPVKLPSGPPPHLGNGLEDSGSASQFEVTTLHLAMASAMQSRRIFPFLSFAGTKHIALDPADVGYSVKNPSPDPVVRLDARTGTVTALRPGHALVRSRYAGAETETCVVVVNDLTEDDASSCQELRGPGSAKRP